MLANESFAKKIEFLYFVISKINHCNIKLQSKTLPIYELRSLMVTCYNQISSLIVKPEKIGSQDLKVMLEQDWDEIETQEEWFMNPAQFVTNLATVSSTKLFGQLAFWNQKASEDFYMTFRSFLAALLAYFQEYLPLTDPILESVDFVRLIEGYDKILTKIHTLNNFFKFAEPESLTEELIQLKSNDFTVYRGLNLPTLEMWDFIEKEGYIYLPKFAKLIHSFPTSSSDLEQGFSNAKLIKTLIRNRLSEQSFEALLLNHEEVRINGQVKVSEKLLDSFDQLMDSLNLKRKPSEELSGIKRPERLPESQPDYRERIEISLAQIQSHNLVECNELAEEQVMEIEKGSES